MPTISKIHGREILDSRGNPTIEVEVHTQSNACGRAAVPSGASTGSFEALELRDDDKQRYLGKGVRNAVNNVNEIIQPALKGTPVNQQHDIDKLLIELDGTQHKSKLGANSILGVSMACARAASMHANIPLYAYLNQLSGQANMSLPTPLINVINGGAHANNALDIQEFMLVPAGFDKFHEALRAGVESFHHLGKLLDQQGHSTAVGDEGGYAPNFESHQQALDTLIQAISNAGYQAGKDIYLALDVAATECFRDSRYHFENRSFDAQELSNWYRNFQQSYPIISIEDGLSEDDWTSWTELNSQLGKSTQLVGDDLFVTNPQRLERGITEQCANAILIKLNQIGTLSETLACIQQAQKASMGVVISHRSGETEDSFIADLAVAVGAGQIKTGSTSRSDRMAKYNQLLRIEEQLETPRYAGIQPFQPYLTSL